MQALAELMGGFATIFGDGWVLFYLVLGAVLGVFIGALPGLTTSAAIAMLAPITFSMEPLSALVFLYVIGKSGRFGGSISAILFNTPGTAAAAATQIDGYPLTRAGKSGKALRTAAASSVIGDLTGEIILIFGALWIATLTLKLGPPETFAIYAAAFVVIGSVMGDSVVKGLIAVCLGGLVAMVGFDPVTAAQRFTFGNVNLLGGFQLAPVLVGMLVFSEVLLQAEAQRKSGGAPAVVPPPARPEDGRLSFAEFRPLIPSILRSSGMGSVIGMLPGLGSSVACFVAYGEEKRRARDAEAWGSGALGGVAAPEAANNAVSGPSMIPVLTLGIPGSTIAAILIGVFLVHGIQVGPAIFRDSADIVFALFAAGLVGILIYGLLGWFAAAWIGRVIGAVPSRFVYPTILFTAFAAAYSVNGNLFDVGVMVAFGGVGYVMRKLGFPPAAFIIAFVLTPGAEQALQQSLLIAQGSWAIFIERPIAATVLGGALLVGGWRAMARKPAVLVETGRE